MNKYTCTRWLLVPVLLVLTGLSALGQAAVTVAGRVTDARTTAPLVGVNIHVKGKIIGTSTDNQGQFSLSTSTTTPFTLVVSMVGFATQEVEVTGSRSDLNLVLQEAPVLGSEVVVAVSRVEESIMRSPVSVEKMDLRAIRETPAHNFYDGLQNLKGVDMIATSLTFKIINTRGFMFPANNRIVQRIDGMDNQAPGLNLPLGNLVGLSDLDAESVEILPGANSALYGPNAFNGVIAMTSKSPFEYQGLSAMTRLGVNHVDGRDAPPSPMYEGMIRYAKAFNNRFAFKVNLAYLKAHDWHANGLENVDPFTYREPSTPATNPAFNALNVYGDETVASLPIGPGGSPVRVARTGYLEKDLVDYDTYSLKGDVALHYRLSEGVEAIYHYKYGAGTSVYQGANRFSINNFTLQQHKAELRGADFFVRAYATLENSGDSYDSRFLGINLNRTWVQDFEGNIVDHNVADQMWFQRYGAAFGGAVAGVSSSDHATARTFADQGRLLPGSPEFAREKKRIAATTDFRRGARFDDQTRMYHAEGQYDFSRWTRRVLDVQVGGNYRLYDLRSNGTIFPDTAGNKITIYEYGAYVQGIRSLLSDRLRLISSLRYDKNENFKGFISPRASAVLTLAQDHNLRASYQTGFRNPTTQDQFIFLDVGQAILVGGVPATSRGLNLYGPGANAFGFSSAQAFGNQVQQAIAGGTSASRAVLENAHLLQQAQVDYVKPEQVQTYEIGYKGLLANRSLLVDVNYYYNRYRDFILNSVVIQPESNITTEKQAAAFDVATSRFQPFALYTNADQQVTAQGASLGLTYTARGYTFGGNTNWNRLNLGQAENPDQVPAFNTPEWKVNLTVANRSLYRNVGFSTAFRWSDAYVWQSSFIAGVNDAVIPAYYTLDAQVSYKMLPIKSILKLGGSNITNNRIRTLYGGPFIGAIYYVSITFDELLH
jgi:iron complex outermembrane recepter protein